jgi:hypothetical protein
VLAPPPEPFDTLPALMVAFAYIHRSAVRALAAERDRSDTDLLNEMWSAAGTVFVLSRGAALDPTEHVVGATNCRIESAVRTRLAPVVRTRAARARQVLVRTGGGS